MLCNELMTTDCMRGSRGGGGRSGPPPPLEKSQKHRVSYQYLPGPPENHKATPPAFNVGPPSADPDPPPPPPPLKNHKNTGFLTNTCPYPLKITNLKATTAAFNVVRVFSDVLVAFLYFDICHYRQSNLAIENPEFPQPVVAGHFQWKIW